MSELGWVRGRQVAVIGIVLIVGLTACGSDDSDCDESSMVSNVELPEAVSVARDSIPDVEDVNAFAVKPATADSVSWDVVAIELSGRSQHLALAVRSGNPEDSIALNDAAELAGVEVDADVRSMLASDADTALRCLQDVLPDA